MNRADKNNLRKLSFLGFGHHSVGSNRDGEVQLDEECAKVFAMDSDHPDFNFQGPELLAPGNPKFDEQDYIQHRQKGYPHVHTPLKICSKSMKRRGAPHAIPLADSTKNPSEPNTPVYDQASTITPQSSVVSKNDSDTGQISSQTLPVNSDEENSESESECVLSDPCNYNIRDEVFSPERKVQFTGEEHDKFDADGLKEKKKRRHHHTHHKFRKYSLPEEATSKKRHHDRSTERRVSTQPEDEQLRGADRDQLDSHRSDDARGLRRHKTSRPSNASIINIGKGVELHPSLKKLYDHSPHAIFVELGELVTGESTTESEWKETARWIKYEEDVEEGVDRWGKPHVASLSFHSLLNLRRCLEDGVVILDLEEKDLPGIAYRVSEDLFKDDLIREEDKAKIMRALLLRHRHVNEHHDRGLIRFSKKHSYTSLQNLYDPERRKVSVPEPTIKNGDADGHLISKDNHIVDVKEETYSTSFEELRKVSNDAILKRIPAQAQGASVLVGEVDFLEQPAIAFVRLAEPIIIPSLIEVNIPVRFIFILLGPKLPNIDYHEVGRSIATLMANKQFHGIAYRTESRKELLSAINEFLDDSIVLPPGDWERQALLPIEEIKAKSDMIKRRKQNALKKEQEALGVIKPLIAGSGDGKKPPFPDPLERTRRPWGGLINDIKRRYPHYKSDVLDGLNAQCAAAAIFMYFAAVSGAIAFGGLLGDKTRNQMGISETLLAACVGGVIFALFCGQPLLIIGTTGPLLLFDESLYQFCLANNLEFLTVRVFISIWLAVIGLIVACFEGSVLVKLFTRFTEDIFSAIIILLYIVESAMKVIHMYELHPILENYCEYNETTMRNASYFDGANDSIVMDLQKNLTDGLVSVTTTEKLPVFSADGPINRPNTALFGTMLTLGTFTIAYYLKMFRNSQFLGRSARRALGDFGVPIAIVIMVFVDFKVPQIFTEKLNVPEGLSPSDSQSRGWFIPPTGTNQKTPVWIMFASIVPALLVYILLFMETHICELIIGKKERKLKKGGGIHLDIVLVCLINIISGFFGFPWNCGATVRSIAHTSALTVMSRTHAPGEKPHLVEVKEQRLSSFLVSIFVGLSVLMSPLLKLIPMAVLFGIFLYMGIASIDGIQFFDRLKLFFMPVKHHPQVPYVRKVRTAKMHLFTFVQLMCLIILWIVKSTKASLAFPFFLILMMPLRNKLLAYIFSQTELRALDGDQVIDDEDEPDFYAEAPLPG